VSTLLRALAPFALASMLQFATHAQEPAPASKPGENPAAANATKTGFIVPLRLQVTISKYQGDKKISSLPYSISVNTTSQLVTLRMGADVPYATNAATSEGKSTPTFSYRPVGISIDTRATLIETGLYRIDLTVSDSSISSSGQVQGAPTVSTVPIFRNFSASQSVVLRDGQSTQVMSATDPIIGETMRVDVTLAVIK
jgi:Flp pilus assembly secretin CpaC